MCEGCRFYLHKDSEQFTPCDDYITFCRRKGDDIYWSLESAAWSLAIEKAKGPVNTPALREALAKSFDRVWEKVFNAYMPTVYRFRTAEETIEGVDYSIKIPPEISKRLDKVWESWPWQAEEIDLYAED